MVGSEMGVRERVMEDRRVGVEASAVAVSVPGAQVVIESGGDTAMAAPAVPADEPVPEVLVASGGDPTGLPSGWHTADPVALESESDTIAELSVIHL